MTIAILVSLVKTFMVVWILDSTIFIASNSGYGIEAIKTIRYGNGSCFLFSI
jgi:hypothetical protein